MLNKRIYLTINSIMLVLAFIWLLTNISSFIGLLGKIQVDRLYYLLFAICLFVIVHLLKACRIYLIMLESNISATSLLKQYFKTTFVTILIPFKIGELLKIVCFSRLAKSFRTGVSAVLIDRFFDTIVLLIFLLIYQMTGNSNSLYITIIIIAFLVIFLLGNIVLYITYPYLNHFLISHGISKKSLRALAYLEQIKNLQRDILKMIKGRTSLISLISFVSWGLEFLVLRFVMELFDKSFGFIQFGNYIEHSFFASTSQLNVFYFCFSSILLILLSSFIYLKSLRKGRTENE